MSCSSTPEEAEPLFTNVDRIEIASSSLSHSAEKINYTLPNSHCRNIVIALFTSDPSVGLTSENVLTVPIAWGTRTGISTFTESSQLWSSLYQFDNTLQDGDGDFNTAISFVPADHAAEDIWLAVWAYDEGGTLIAASPAFGF
jgi:hypothetical protein